MEQFQVRGKIKGASYFVIWLLAVSTLAWVFFSYIRLHELRLCPRVALSKMNHVEICSGPCFTGGYSVLRGIHLYRSQ